jgi:7,8-dihydro-6-hydroxymethylpterin-pyrophosphokinase
LLGFGSNWQHQENWQWTRDQISQRFDLLAASTPRMSEALGESNEIHRPPYLNALLIIRSQSARFQIQRVLKALEHSREPREGGRVPLDLDLIARALAQNLRVYRKQDYSAPYWQAHFAELADFWRVSALQTV